MNIIKKPFYKLLELEKYIIKKRRKRLYFFFITK